jgi:hypothetical protein
MIATSNGSPTSGVKSRGCVCARVKGLLPLALEEQCIQQHREVRRIHAIEDRRDLAVSLFGDPRR